LQKNDNSIVKQALHCKATEDGDHGIPGDPESEMGTAGFKYNWRKMEAQDRTGWMKSGL